MDLDSFTLDEHRFKRLNTKTVQSWSAIHKHRVLANHLFQNVPNDRLLPFHHLARLLDRGGVRLLLELVVNEWLEQLERHLLWQTALVEFQFGGHNNNWPPRVIHAFAQQVLTETSLLAFQRSAQRLE